MERTYRQLVQPEGLCGYRVLLAESDLLVHTAQDLRLLALDWLQFYRRQLLRYLAQDASFQTSLLPLPLLPEMPAIVRSMAAAAEQVGVGPMAAVAGTIAEYVGRHLAERSASVIVENGGDIWLESNVSRNVLIHAGRSSWSERLAIRLPPDGPWAVCTSSGTIGHSLSFGRADAAVALSRNGSLADAAATALGNRVQTATDIPAALNFASSIPGLLGSVLICGEELGVWGQVELHDPKGGM